MINTLDFKHATFYVRIAPSILGAKIRYIRLPHQQKVATVADIDKAVGTHNGVAAYLENKWRGGYYRIATREEEFLCTFDKNEDGTIQLGEVNESPVLWKVYGDVLRYCLYGDVDGYKAKLTDMDIVPEWENGFQIAYKIRIEYRVLVEA